MISPGPPDSSDLPEPPEPYDLEDVLARIAQAQESDSNYTSVGDILAKLGRRSFAPLLLIPGLVTLLPVGAMPGVPTAMGMLVLVASIQLLIGRRFFWLPAWLLNRSAPKRKLETSRRWLERPAIYIDHLLRPRLSFMTRFPGSYLIALLSTIIALLMPLMEFIPFSATGAGLALTLFGLALMAHDGALALIGIFATTGTLWLLIQYIF